MSALLHDPLTSLLITLLAFYGFGEVQKKLGGHAMLNPVVWAIITCVVFIKVSGTHAIPRFDPASPIRVTPGQACHVPPARRSVRAFKGGDL